MQVKPEQLIFTDHAIERYFDRVLSVKADKEKIMDAISHMGIKRTGYLAGVKIVPEEKAPKWAKWLRKGKLASHYLLFKNKNIVCPVVQREDKWIVLTTLHKENM